MVELAVSLAERRGIVPPKRAKLQAAFDEMDDDGSGEVWHYMTQPLVELYGGCRSMVVLNVS